MKGERIQYTFTAENLNWFLESECKRDVKKTNKLKQSYENGWDIINPLIVKKKEKYYQIIDGHHRYFALKDFFNSNPTAIVPGEVYCFGELTQEESIELYLTLDDMTRKQTVNDALKVSSPLAKVYDYFEKSFPVPLSFSSSTVGLPYARLFKTYLDRKHRRTTDMQKQTLIKKVIVMSKSDYDYLREFYEVMYEVFGKYTPNNEYYFVASLYILMKIWESNKSSHGVEKLVKLFRDKIYKNPEFMRISTSRNRIEIDNACNNLERELNKGNRGLQIIFGDLKEELE